MVPRRVYLYVILTNGTPQSVPWLAPTFQIFFMPHRAHFFHLVLFLNCYSLSAPVYFSLKGWNTSFWQLVPRRVYIYVILAHGTPQSVPRLAPTFSIFFIPHRAHFFSTPTCAVIILNGAPSSAPVYFLLKGWYISFWQMIPRRVHLNVILANGDPQSVPRLAPTFRIFLCPFQGTLFYPIVCSYYFQRCPIECAC